MERAIFCRARWIANRGANFFSVPLHLHGGGAAFGGAQEGGVRAVVADLMGAE
jgi:hypothetical protein